MKVAIGEVSSDGTFPVTLHLRTTVKTGTLRLEPGFDDARKAFAARAASLATALREQSPGLVRSFTRASASAHQLVLEIGDPRLYDVPWESAFYRLLPQRPFWGCFRVVPATRPQPPSLPPYQVLWADVANPASEAPSREPPRELRHYSSTVDTQATPSSLADLASQEHFQVVHLAGIEALKRGGRGTLALSGSPQTVSPTRLRSLVDHPPKLLLLEGALGNKSTLIDFGHRYAKVTGAAVLVTEPIDPAASRKLSKVVYLGIAHDQPLDELAANLTHAFEQAEPPVLIMPPGGQEVLRLDQPESTVRSWYRNLEALTSDQINQLRVARRTAMQMGASSSFRGSLDDHQKRLKKISSSLKKQKLDLAYHAESAGIEPMAEAAQTAAAAASAIDQAAAVTERVANTCFLWRKRPVSKQRDLVCGRKYLLQVQIGALSPHSNNRSPRGVPEEYLERFMTPEGVELRVVVQSRHFEILEPQKPLLLPPQPLDSEAQTFGVVAPADPGPGEIMLLIYYRTNLLQAIRLWAQVSRPGQKVTPRGNYAETEFALEQLTASVEELPQRDAQLYVSVGKNPTHTLTVEGTGAEQPFELSVGKLRNALRQARTRLLQLAESYYVQRGGRRISPDELLDDLRILAQTGFGFFDTLLPEAERESLATKVAGHRTLQIAHSKSLEQIYPWALVYDHPLLAIKPRLCPDAKAVLEQGGATVDDLEQLDCMSKGCRHRGEQDTICPSGFWGFRHTIELPLSLETSDDGPRGLNGDGGMKRSIAAGPEARLCMAAWRDFKSLKKHEAELRKIARLQVDGPQYEKGHLHQALKQGNQNILYFYCHGDHNPAVAPPTVLRLGWKNNEDYVYGTDMSSFVKLQSPRPLVFINGCHTLETDPDELVSFNRKLSEGGSSAVIGTEIKVHERLAAPAGEALLRDLVGGTPLGQAMRRFRLGLLLNRNVLGLAYTSFGFSDLTIEVG